MNVYGELTRAQLENLAADPTLATVTKGRLWYRTDLTAPKIDLGGSADTLALLSLAQTLLNKTIDTGPSAVNPNIFKSTGATALQVPVADGSGNVSWATQSSAPDSSTFFENGSISASVSAGALTINLMTKAGSTPSGGSPVSVGMRNATAATGTYNFRTVTSALSLVVPSGTTLGTASAVTTYLYIYLMDNAGTLVLAISGSAFDEGSLQSSTAIAAGASVSTLYSTAGQSSLPIRLIGRIKVNETTAGTWASSPTEISNILFYPPVNYKAPTQQRFTSGSGTYTTPTFPPPLYIEIEMVGGGGAGGSSGVVTVPAGGAGGNSTFGTSLLVANGGAGGQTALSGGTGGAGGTASLGSVSIGIAVSGGSGTGNSVESSGAIPPGGPGGSSALGGNGGGAAAGQTGFSGVTNTGGGGGGGGGNTSIYSGNGGGAGGYVKAVIPAPVSSYAYAVGAAGSAGSAGTSGSAGGAGGSGIIVVTEYYQ
jgi:hypothetical protein